jgi:hypothetical protein
VPRTLVREGGHPWALQAQTAISARRSTTADQRRKERACASPRTAALPTVDANPENAVLEKSLTTGQVEPFLLRLPGIMIAITGAPFRAVE